MKIQNLAIIFIIIILPISVILSSYIDNQIKTINLQTDYDVKLSNATYDAIKAFQLNTINSSTSDLSNSKMRDLEASANVFFSSIANQFNMSGYNKDVLKEYVPALVFTLYDGYYIYAPYTNTLTNTDVAGNSEKISGLKPYIYYSCRYKKGVNLDVVITYSLDNYIVVQGFDKHGQVINDSGYLLDNVTVDDGTVKYRGVEIEKEPTLTENLYDREETNMNNAVKSYQYVKVNGVKHYKDNNGNWFTLLNGEKYMEPSFQAGNRQQSRS